MKYRHIIIIAIVALIALTGRTSTAAAVDPFTAKVARVAYFPNPGMLTLGYADPLDSKVVHLTSHNGLSIAVNLEKKTAVFEQPRVEPLEVINPMPGNGTVSIVKLVTKAIYLTSSSTARLVSVDLRTGSKTTVSKFPGLDMHASVDLFSDPSDSHIAWVGAFNSVWKYDDRIGKLTPFKLDTIRSVPPQTGRLFFASTDALWSWDHEYVSGNYALARYDIKKKAWMKWSKKDYPNMSPLDEGFNTELVEIGGVVYVGDSGSYYAYDAIKNTWTAVKSDLTRTKDQAVWCGGYSTRNIVCLNNMARGTTLRVALFSPIEDRLTTILSSTQMDGVEISAPSASQRSVFFDAESGRVFVFSQLINGHVRVLVENLKTGEVAITPSLDVQYPSGIGGIDLLNNLNRDRPSFSYSNHAQFFNGASATSTDGRARIEVLSAHDCNLISVAVVRDGVTRNVDININSKNKLNTNCGTVGISGYRFTRGSNKDFWLATDRGIIHLDTESLKYRVFNTGDVGPEGWTGSAPDVLPLENGFLTKGIDGVRIYQYVI